jgi:hypothetical protein
MHLHMNVEIGTEDVQFPEKEYINGIFVLKCILTLSAFFHSLISEDLQKNVSLHFFKLMFMRKSHVLLRLRNYSHNSIKHIIAACGR